MSSASVYLGVTLDRTLRIKQHQNKGKGRSQEQYPKEAVQVQIGNRSGIIRHTALALCYLAAEYACHVWGRSTHVKKMDLVFNMVCIAITGCLKPTQVDDLYLQCAIAPPSMIRTPFSQVVRTKHESDLRHPLFQ